MVAIFQELKFTFLYQSLGVWMSCVDLEKRYSAGIIVKL